MGKAFSPTFWVLPQFTDKALGLGRAHTACVAQRRRAIPVVGRGQHCRDHNLQARLLLLSKDPETTGQQAATQLCGSEWSKLPYRDWSQSSRCPGCLTSAAQYQIRVG